MGLISTQDIAEITKIATDLAAQTMKSNGEIMLVFFKQKLRFLIKNFSKKLIFSKK